MVELHLHEEEITRYSVFPGVWFEEKNVDKIRCHSKTLLNSPINASMLAGSYINVHVSLVRALNSVLMNNTNLILIYNVSDSVLV